MDLPVEIICGINHKPEIVYFHPIEIDKKLYVSIDSFNGCEDGYHGCQQCDDCKQKAFDLIDKT